MKCQRKLSDAQHEAAHVVVGAACGLRLRRAVLADEIDNEGHAIVGHAEFSGWSVMRASSFGLMYAAGPAWGNAVHEPWQGRYDRIGMREMGFNGAEIKALIMAAGAILRMLAAQHALVTRLLLERDITQKDLDALARGLTTEAILNGD